MREIGLARQTVRELRKAIQAKRRTGHGRRIIYQGQTYFFAVPAVDEGVLSAAAVGPELHSVAGVVGDDAPAG